MLVPPDIDAVSVSYWFASDMVLLIVHTVDANVGFTVIVTPAEQADVGVVAESVT